MFPTNQEIPYVTVHDVQSLYVQGNYVHTKIRTYWVLDYKINPGLTSSKHESNLSHKFKSHTVYGLTESGLNQTNARFTSTTGKDKGLAF